jgi:hypothetical protein
MWPCFDGLAAETVVLVAAIACTKVNSSDLLGVYTGIAANGKDRINFRNQ